MKKNGQRATPEKLHGAINHERASVPFLWLLRTRILEFANSYSRLFRNGRHICLFSLFTSTGPLHCRWYGILEAQELFISRKIRMRLKVASSRLIWGHKYQKRLLKWTAICCGDELLATPHCNEIWTRSVYTPRAELGRIFAIKLRRPDLIKVQKAWTKFSSLAISPRKNTFCIAASVPQFNQLTSLSTAKENDIELPSPRTHESTSRVILSPFNLLSTQLNSSRPQRQGISS